MHNKQLHNKQLGLNKQINLDNLHILHMYTNCLHTLYRNCSDIRLMLKENASFTHAKPIKTSMKQKMN